MKNLMKIKHVPVVIGLTIFTAIFMVSVNILTQESSPGRTVFQVAAANDVVTCEAQGKVTICHVPPENPDNPQTICVDDDAVQAHLEHGDSRGECPPPPPEPTETPIFTPTPEPTATLTPEPGVTPTPTPTPTLKPGKTPPPIPTPTPTVTPTKTPSPTPTPVAVPQLEIQKSVNPSEIRAGKILVYTITITNHGAGTARAVKVFDMLPPIMQYIAGTSIINGSRVEDPQLQGNQRLAWELGDLPSGEQKTLKYQTMVLIGAKPGVYYNRAIVQAADLINRPVTAGPAKAKVVVRRSDRKISADLAGLVFEDRNGNGVQDAGEPGMSGMRVILVRDFTRQTTAANGEFFFGDIEPGEQAVGLDETSLPQGYHLTTDATVLVRLSEGDRGDVEFGVQADVLPSPTPTTTPSPTATPSPAPTATPVVEPTVEPVPTSTPTPEPTATPTPTPEAEEFCAYSVRPGDWLSTIASRLTGQMDNYREIMQVNNLTSEKIRVGDVLQIPKRLLLPEYQSCEGTLIEGQIRVHVYLDRNENQVFDAGDGPLAGIEARLSSGAKQITDKEGSAVFPNVLPGEVDVSLDQGVLPATMHLAGNASVKVAIVDDMPVDVTFRVVEADPYAYLEGRVFFDKNGDEQYDANDLLVEQFTAVLGERLRTQGEHGKFVFAHLDQGASVLEIQYAGNSAKRTIELKGGRNSVDIPLRFSGVIVIVKEGGQAQ